MKVNNNFPETQQQNTPANIFVSSVEAFSSEDIDCEPDKDKRKKIVPLLIRCAFMAVAFGIFCYSVYAIASRMTESAEQEEFYRSLGAENTTVSSAVEKPNKLREPSGMLTLLEMLEANGEIPEYEEEFIDDPERYENNRKKLVNALNINSKMYGWVVFTGSNRIDYPVLLDPDKSYDDLLHHDIRGRKSSSGSIFTDKTLSRNHQDNYNVIIYGHCMTNGSMFRDLRYWYNDLYINRTKRDKMIDDTKIEIYTLDAVYVYDIFCTYRSEDFNFTETYFKDEADYKRFLDSIYSRSPFRNDIPYSAQSRICTLVTCTNVTGHGDERYVVHGILRQVIPYE